MGMGKKRKDNSLQEGHTRSHRSKPNCRTTGATSYPVSGKKKERKKTEQRKLSNNPEKASSIS